MRTFSAVLCLTFLCGKASADAFADFKGNWKGLWTIDDRTSTRLYFKIAKAGNGTYTATFDTLDWNANNIPTTSVIAIPPYVRLNFTNVGYFFEGNVNSNFTQITGIWNGGGGVWPLTIDRNPSVDEMQARTYSDSFGSLPYRLFVPTNYSVSQTLPLVLFLHGAGERGSDNRLQITGQSGPLAFTFNENQAKQPCFLAAPQCPAGGTWIDTARHSQLLGLITTLKTEFNIDPDRVYVTGLSMGGHGTWDLLGRNGNLFAAGIPMSGTPTLSASTFFQIPIWNFHAADDGTVSVSGSRNAITGMRSLGGTPIYTEYAQGGHVIWSSAYATPLLFDWVMAQKRGVVTNAPPFVIINSPSNQTNYSTAGSTVFIAGTTDSSAGITNITWTNNRAGSGTAIGTSNWSIPSVNLQSGTNLLTVLATALAEVLGYGGTTTFSDTIKINRVTLPVLAVTRTNGSVRITWTGGAPPYSIQMTTNLSSGLWEAIPMDTTNSATWLMDQPETFFRVLSQ